MKFINHLKRIIYQPEISFTPMYTMGFLITLSNMVDNPPKIYEITHREYRLQLLEMQHRHNELKNIVSQSEMQQNLDDLKKIRNELINQGLDHSHEDGAIERVLNNIQNYDSIISKQIAERDHHVKLMYEYAEKYPKYRQMLFAKAELDKLYELYKYATSYNPIIIMKLGLDCLKSNEILNEFKDAINKDLKNYHVDIDWIFDYE